MKRVGGILLLMLLGVFAKAQNLVPNPSFEEYEACPGWNNYDSFVVAWFEPGFGSSDYFHECAEAPDWPDVPNNFLGYQQARTGVAYSGLLMSVTQPASQFMGSREYIEVQLLDSLEADTLYCVEFFVSRAGALHTTATSSIQMHISSTVDWNELDNYLNYLPQIINDPTNVIIDTLNWIRISGEYIAVGGELFITIGNFYSEDSTTLLYDTLSYNAAYYYIDDVSVMKCSQVGTSVQSVAQQLNIQLNPNPVSDELQITVNGLVGNAKIEIVNVIGQIVFSQNVKATNNFHEVVDMTSLPTGLYFVRVSSNDKSVAQKIVKQ